MIRHYYDLCRQGTFVVKDNEHFVVEENSWDYSPVIKYYMDVLTLHTDCVRVEFEDHFAPVGETPEIDPYAQPWECIGTYPNTKRMREYLRDEEWRRLIWHEGISDACHLYFDLLKAEVERHQGCVRVLCRGGPYDGDVINMRPCNKRAIIDNAVYERSGDSMLAPYDNKDIGHFVRDA